MTCRERVRHDPAACRLLALLPDLSAPRLPTVTQLARDLHWNRKMVCRKIVSLRRDGFDIDYRRGGVFWHLCRHCGDLRMLVRERDAAAQRSLS